MKTNEKYKKYGQQIWDFIIETDKKFFRMRDLVEQMELSRGKILLGLRWLRRNNKITKISNKTWRVERDENTENEMR